MSWRTYDRSCLPKEFVGVMPESFLVDPSQHKFCFLEKHLLFKICEKLSPEEFVRLSRTCRFLRWRIFTFCRCYKSVGYLKIQDAVVEPVCRPQDWESTASVYFLEDVLLRRTEVDGTSLLLKSTIEKPFFFEKIELDLDFESYSKSYYDRCLPLLVSIRNSALQLDVNFKAMQPSISFPATDDFLRTIKATSFRCKSISANSEIYVNCPYTQQMDRACIGGFGDILKNFEGKFLNRIGRYFGPSDASWKATIEEFLYGSTALNYHFYSFDCNYESMAYLFDRFEDWEEYCCDNRRSWHFRENCRRELIFSKRWDHVWYKTITRTEAGRAVKLRITKDYHHRVNVAIGREETFDELDKGRMSWEANQMRWRMETAVEPVEIDHRLKDCATSYIQLKTRYDWDDKDMEQPWRLGRACYEKALKAADKDGKVAILLEGLSYCADAYKQKPSCYEAVKYAAAITLRLVEYEGAAKKMDRAHLFKEYLDKAISIDYDNYSLLHLRGRFLFEMVDFFWHENQAAAVFFTTPQMAICEALASFLAVYNRRPNWLENVYYIAKTYDRMKDKANTKKFVMIGLALPFCGESETEIRSHMEMVKKHL